MKIPFWVDPHIGKFNKLLGEEASLQMSRKLISFQIEETRKLKAQHAIMLGDLFNRSNPSIDEMNLVIEMLSSASDISIIAMLGNHDVYDANTNSFKLLAKLPKAGALKNVTFVTKQQLLHWAKINILVLPFGSKPNKPDADLIVFHDRVIGAKFHHGPPVGMGQGIHQSKFQNILAVGGDIHLSQRVGDNIFYPGTIADNDFGETGDKYFGYVETNDLSYHKYKIKPLWQLKTVNWSNKNPPVCDEPNTYYRLMVADERPPARWMTDHPQVVKTEGGSKSKQKEATQQVIKILQGENKNNETDSQILSRWMKEFTPLDKLSRMQGLKIHEKLVKSG